VVFIFLFFVLKVYVNDSSGFDDTTRVLVYLLRQDQRVNFVLRQHPQFLRTRIDQFREYVSIIKSLTSCEYNTFSPIESTEHWAILLDRLSMWMN
jgi:hypothetical protein